MPMICWMLSLVQNVSAKHHCHYGVLIRGLQDTRCHKQKGDFSNQTLYQVRATGDPLEHMVNHGISF
jgi:hypothetical protein